MPVMDDFPSSADIKNLSAARVLCVGDVMLDRFVYGDVSRVSPEAPIPVCRVRDETSMLGGAGNVVRNLAALGAEAIFITVIGDDDAGAEIDGLISAQGNISPEIFREDNRRSTVKTRYVADGQQLLRADRESEDDITDELAQSVIERVRARLPEAGAVLLSDYGKGVLTDAVTAAIIEAAHAAGKPVIVDPKGVDYTRYRGATLLTPNRRELAEASFMKADGDAGIIDAARHIVESCGVDAILATRGPEGITLVTMDGHDHLAANALEVYDVSGAGDTVAAAMSAALATGMNHLEAARLANIAAGIVVAKAGTAVAAADEIATWIAARDDSGAGSRSVGLDEALGRIKAWRAQGDRIGFTNGCFDLIHPGHISLLQQAHDNCDRLIVGLNSDRSTSRLKGPERPIQPEGARATVLGAFETVDLVVIFEEDTPLKLIDAIRPDVLIKGADYSLDEVVGGDKVQAYGGKVVLAELTPGQSTTGTISRMSK
jgi:D-beta-D-heptose 7-phosphate kinase / D-beta-D-heptose 1-phosphate adenosyltransferase